MAEVGYNAASIALIRGLRRPQDEVQLTQALASVFQTDTTFASRFCGLLLHTLGRRADDLPAQMTCRTEELVDEGRVDLRFSAPTWDVIVEVKIHAGYGRDQIGRYLRALRPEPNRYLIAITRDVPWGEPPSNESEGWLGAIRWRRLLPGLRAIAPADVSLREQWPLFLDVLEQEGSMGFTRPDPELFDTWARLRVATNHIEEFLKVLQVPLLNALREAAGGGVAAADFYRARGGRGRPVISRARWGKTDLPFLVPADGPARVRAGLLGWNPPALFFVEPNNGRKWVTKQSNDSFARDAVRMLIERGFEPAYLRSYLELSPARLASQTLEEDVVEWAHARFLDIRDSGLLSPSAPVLAGDEPDGDGEEGR